MRILFVLETLGVGGAERLTITIGRRLVARGHEVGICTLYSRDDGLRPAAEAAGIVVLGSPSNRRWSAPARVYRAIREFSPAIVHTNLSDADIAARAAATAFPRVGLVTTFHNRAYLFRPRNLRTTARRFLERTTASRNDALIAVSQS